MNKEELKELAATLSGIADGERWERTNSITGEWCDPDHCGPELCLVMGRKIRLKPEQQKAPLGPGDVPPGSAFTAIPDTFGYCCPVVVDEDGCYFASRDDGQDKTVSWDAMVDDWQINRSIPLTGKWNPEAWQPCYKLIDTP